MVIHVIQTDQILAMEDTRKRHFYSDVQCRGYYPAYKLKEYEREGVLS